MHSSRMCTGRSLTVCQSLLPGGVYLVLGGGLLWGGASAPEADTPPWTESQTPVKTLPWPNFVAAGKLDDYRTLKPILKFPGQSLHSSENSRFALSPNNAVVALIILSPVPIHYQHAIHDYFSRNLLRMINNFEKCVLNLQANCNKGVSFCMIISAFSQDQDPMCPK